MKQIFEMKEKPFTSVFQYMSKSLLLRECWIIYRGPGFLAVVPYYSVPRPSPPSASCLTVCRRSSLLVEEGERGWAWSQIIRPRESLALHNHSILSAATDPLIFKDDVILLLDISFMHVNIGEKKRGFTFYFKMDTMDTVAHRFKFLLVGLPQK